MAELDPLVGVTVFVTAARSGSFTQAAERLGITKSAVGKSIAKLEERLGTKLFHRTTRVNKLTHDGDAYFEACAAAIDEITAVEAALTTRTEALSRRVRIDMPVAFGRRVLLPLLFEISRPHPALALTLTFTDATIDPVREDVDLVVRFGALKDSSHLVARHLVDQDRVICASPSYLREHGCPISLDDLSTHQCVVGSPKGPPLTWTVRQHGVVKRLAPPATHQLSDGDAMLDAAVGGFGIVQLPSSLVRGHIENGRLISILSNFSTVPIEIHAVWPRQEHLSPRVRYIVDHLVAHAAQGRLS